MGLLAVAGAFSGLGDGLRNAASQGMQFAGASMLAKEREAMELKRLEIMERFASAREQRGFAHAERMQAQNQDFTRGENRAQREFSSGEAEKQRGFTAGESEKAFDRSQTAADRQITRQEEAAARERDRQRNPKEIAADAKAESLKHEIGAPLRQAKQKEEITAEITKINLLAEDPTYLSSVEKIAAAKEGPSAKADTAIKLFNLESSKESRRLQDAYVKAVDSGDQDQIKKAKESWQAFAAKPWEIEKADQVAITAGLKESGNEIVRLQAMLKDALPGSSEALAIQRRLSTAESAHAAYDARLRELTGTTAKAAEGKRQIKDPFKQAGTMTAQDEGPQPRGEKVLPVKPPPPTTPESPSFTFGPAEPIVEGAKGLIGRAKDALMPFKGETQIAKIPQQQGAPNPQVEQMIAQRRAELAERQGGKLPTEPQGMLPTAEASIPPAQEPQRQPPAEPTMKPSKLAPGLQQYEPLIQKYAGQYGVRPELLRALVDAESSGKPGEVSRKGARGLTQLMPGTAKDMGVTDPHDPEQAIMGGAKYLSQLLRKYNGDEATALAAYNWGPRRVDGGGTWPEETRVYVQKVLTNAGAAQPAAEPRTALDWFQQLPPEKQEQMQQILDEYQAGRRTEEQFATGVIALIGSGTQGQVIADNIIRRVRGMHGR